MPIKEITTSELYDTLKALLKDAPMFGTCSLELIIRGGKVVRVITRREESKLVV